MFEKKIRVATIAVLSAIAWVAAPLTLAADIGKLAESCANCHGKDGVSQESDVPTIAGQSADYLAGTIAAYKKKERTCPETKYKAGDKKGSKTDMCQITKDLSESDAKELGKHYAGKKFVRMSQKAEAALVPKGKKLHDEYCEKCHTDGGSSPGDDAGILAGQSMPYLDEQLREFVAGKRVPPKKMKAVLDKVDRDGYTALVNYYGSMK